jgi:hypothetical protein
LTLHLNFSFSSVIKIKIPVNCMKYLIV